MSSPNPLLAFASELDESNRERINRKLVHKSELTHVFVKRIESLPRIEDGHDRFLAPLVIDSRHPFFFEHPLDHVPGLMLIEGTRQVGTAISHLVYDVSFDLTFILNWLEVRFASFAELTSPVFVQMTIIEKAYRHGRLNGLTCKSQWLQDGRPLGTMDAEWSFSSPAVLSRLRRGPARDCASACTTVRDAAPASATAESRSAPVPKPDSGMDRQALSDQ